MRRFFTGLLDEAHRGPRPPTAAPPADGGYPADSDLHQMTDDGCPLGPDPARWADPEWRDDPAEGSAGGQDNLGELDTFDAHPEPDSCGRRREFGELADRLSAQVRGALIGPGTGVYLVYRYADRGGNEHPRRRSVTPGVYEAASHRDAVIGTVHAFVRAAPTGWVTLPEGPDRQVRIAGFDLEIVTAR
jgi:hypothetical protein